MSPQSWCCHRSAMVPKGIALPSAAQALGRGGPWEGLHHPSSALQGRVLSPLLPAASKQGSISIWTWWLLACAKAAGRRPGTSRHAGSMAPSFGFRFLQPFSSSPSECPSATAQTLRASQSAQHGRDSQNLPSSPARLLSHSFPSKEALKIECGVFTEHYSVQILSENEERPNLISSSFYPVWPQNATHPCQGRLQSIPAMSCVGWPCPIHPFLTLRADPHVLAFSCLINYTRWWVPKGKAGFNFMLQPSSKLLR